MGPEERKLKEIKLRQIALLREKEKQIRENKLLYFTRPNPLQAKLLSAWNDPSIKVFGMGGANRIGKTTIGTIIAFATLAGYWPWSKQPLYFPHSLPRKVRYIGQDWESHVKTVVLPAFREWWPAKWKLTTKKNTQGYEATWIHEDSGSILEILTNKQEDITHEGWYGDLVIYDEPPQRAKRIANARGLIDRGGREFFGMTLLEGAWIDKEVIHARLPNGDPDPTYFFVEGSMDVNVGFGIRQEDIAQFSKALTEDERDARIKGIPAYKSGILCPDFDRKIHIVGTTVEPFEIPLDWPVDVAIDIHPKKKQAVTFMATSPQNSKYVCDELWFHGDGKAVAEAIIRRASYMKYRLGRIIIDPLAKSDSNNPSTTYDKIDAVLYQFGYLLETASKDKDSGILEINNRLMGPNKIPSLFFVRGKSTKTIEELEGWMIDPKTGKPLKEDDDFVENLYRLLLLDTAYEPPFDEDEEEDTGGTKNKVTGY